MRASLLAVILCCAALGAGEFDAVAFYGAPYFKPSAAKPRAGTLTLKLDDARQPFFVELNNSDDGPAQARFDFTQTGAVLTPAGEKATCELALDVGAIACTATVSVVELDVRASAGFHIVPLDGGAEIMAAVTRSEQTATLRISKRGRNGMATLASIDIAADFRAANTLSVTVGNGALVANFAGTGLEQKLPIGAFTLGLAASDGRCRFSGLIVDAEFDPAWAEDAQTRLLARQALTRLREYCAEGLLAGILRCEHPAQTSDLASYSAQERKARIEALASRDFQFRLEALTSLARAKPQSALAAYDAGASALLAGNPRAARVHLEASIVLQDCGLTRLLLAEASRRLRDFSAAQAGLEKAAVNLPAELAPDLELMRARLSAARGELAAAHKTLSTAREKWQQHEGLGLFAQSAQELVLPQGLAQSQVRGPFGLLVVSDVEDAALAKLFARLEPYCERIRHWLPKLHDKLDGTLAVYANPTGYLRAALLVAGDSLDNVAGMFLPSGFGEKRSIISCRAFGEDELVRTLAHELWHLAVSTTDASQMAPWLNEGMAVYISAGTPKAGLITFRSLPSEFTAFAAEIPASLAAKDAAESALAAGYDRFYQPGEQHLNYAMAWALVWYLAEQDLTSARTLRELIAGERETLKSFKESLAQVLPRIVKALKDRKMLP